MATGEKRKAEGHSGGDSKKAKVILPNVHQRAGAVMLTLEQYNKFKSTNRGADNTLSSATVIEPGTSGIWATCVRGLEAKSTGQLRDVLEEYGKMMYPDAFPSGDGDGDDKTAATGDDADDIEAAIKAELDDIKGAGGQQSFKTVRIDVACVLFFKTESPVDPVALVHRICSDAAAGKAAKRTRHVNRLTPMTLMGKASPAGLEELGKAVLAPHFHAEGSMESKSYAIRATVRNNDLLSRSLVIEKVAKLVDDRHKVNLSEPDLVILVDVYKKVCGMSVVSGEYERLKRYNLNELYGIAPEKEASE